MNGVVYFARKPRGVFTKVGRSVALSKRMKTLRLQPLLVLEPFDGDEKKLERRLHVALAPYRAFPEREASFGNEWFALIPEALDAICSIIGRDTTDYLRGHLPRAKFEFVA